ncbi:MAG: acyl--CoA ligase [Desulfobacteraceae bacterium]|nr:acyl--CoA ligase [Desulfobacteraceae bacterium]
MNKQIYHHFRKYANQEFLFDAITDTIFTYQDIFEKAAGMANILFGNTCGRNSKIAIISDNSVEFIAYYFSVVFLGATAIPLNPNYTKEDNSFAIRKIEPNLILLPDKVFESKIDKQLKEEYCFLSTDKLDFKNIRNKELVFDLPDIEWDDLASILFTSGTTGKPKGVGMKYGAILECLSTYGKDLQFTENTRFMQVVPLFHAHGWLYSSIVPALFGSSVILNESFNIRVCAKFWNIVKKYQATVSVVVPSILNALLEMSKRYEEVPKKFLKYFICGSSFLHTNLKQNFENTFDTLIYEFYGSTETIYLAYHQPDQVFKIGTVGKLFPKHVQIKIADSSEICVKTKYLFKGYINDPSPTEQAIDSDGWYHTGDSGKIDEHGYIRLTGRLKNIINKGGYKISPHEIDNCLRKFKDIVDSATIGVPDEMYGEEIYSFVSIRNGNGFNEQEIAKYCKAHLRETICPKRILLIPEIPKNAIGKTDKFKLTQIYQDFQNSKQ